MGFFCNKQQVIVYSYTSDHGQIGGIAEHAKKITLPSGESVVFSCIRSNDIIRYCDYLEEYGEYGNPKKHMNIEGVMLRLSGPPLIYSENTTPVIPIKYPIIYSRGNILNAAIYSVEPNIIKENLIITNDLLQKINRVMIFAKQQNYSASISTITEQDFEIRNFNPMELYIDSLRS